MKIMESLRIAEDYNVITEHKESDLKKRFVEVVEERNDLLDQLIEWLLVRESWNKDQFKIICKRELQLIEKITEKSWDEIRRIRS